VAYGRIFDINSESTLVAVHRPRRIALISVYTSCSSNDGCSVRIVDYSILANLLSWDLLILNPVPTTY